MTQLITNSKGSVKTVPPADPDDVKAYGGYNAGYGLLFSGAGMVGRNQDLTPTRSGAASAYQLIPAVNRAVTLRADAVQALTWELVRKTENSGNNGKEQQKGEVIDNSEAQSASTAFGEAMREAQKTSRLPLIWSIVFDHDLYGEVYVEPLGNAYRVNGLKRLNPLGMFVDVQGGEIVGYRWNPSGNTATTDYFEPDEIAYVHTMNPFDDFRGQGLLEVAMDTLNISRNLKRWLMSFFRNNARPSAIISPAGEDNFSEPQRNIIKSEVEMYVKGSDNAYSTLVSPTPIRLDVYDQPDIQNQYSINDGLNAEIYTIFGVPAAMAGDQGRSRYKSGLDILDAFYINTVIPLARWTQDYINFQVLPFFHMDDVTFRFDLSEFDQVSSDDAIRITKAREGYQGGIWTQNEARTYTGLDTVAAGDTFYAAPAPTLGAGSTPISVREPALPTPPQLGTGDTAADMEAEAEGDAKSVQVGESAYVSLSLADDPQIISIQDGLKVAWAGIEGIEWQSPDTYHVTLVYCNAATDDNMAGIARAVTASAVSIHADAFGIFENEGSRALYLAVTPTPDLKRLQAQLYREFADRELDCSPFSVPAQFKPHITLAYLPAGAELPEQFVGLHTQASTIAFGRDDYALALSVMLSSKPVQTPISELKAWKAKASKGNATKSFVADAIPVHVSEWVRAELNKLGAGATKSAIHAVFEDAAYALGDWHAVKDYETTEAEFYDAVEHLIQSANDDEVSRAKFSGQLRSALRRNGLSAFRDGLERGGYSPESFSPDELKVFKEWLDEQSAYARHLSTELFKDGEVPDARTRADMWRSKSLDDIYYRALEMSAPEMQGTWQVGDTDHCATCLGNNGQTKSISEWRAAGMPRSDALDCKGFKCQCSILDADGQHIGAIR